MKIKKTFFKNTLAAFGVVFAGAALAGTGAESHKYLDAIVVNNDGSVYITVLSPSDSATNCYFSIIQIPADSTSVAKNQWLSQLIAAKTANLPVTLSYTYSSSVCTLGSVQL